MAHVRERLQSFIDSDAEIVFCYEPLGRVEASWPAAQKARALLESRLVACNNVYARSRGASRPEELFGKPMRELAQESMERIEELLRMLIEEGCVPNGIEVKQRRPDGEVAYALAKGQVVTQDGVVRHLWVILRDITKQKRVEQEQELLQARLRQAERMESLGMLAGGIAHDFNNLLVAISGFTEVARSHVPESCSEAMSALDEVLAASGRAAELTQALLGLSRERAFARSVLDVNHAISQVMGLVRRIVPERIELRFVPGQLQGQASLDPIELDRSIVNLCANAAEATREAGAVSVETDQVDLTEEELRARAWMQPGPHVRVRVTDTGPGIPEALRERIFEPFFTTKLGQNTGLGLATVYSIARRHGGHAYVESPINADGTGSRFTLLFPLLSTDASQKEPERGRISAHVASGETILLAEDDPSVRRVLQGILTRAGYTVLTAQNGVEAIRLFEQHRETIRLAVVDAVMPVKGGAEVVAALRASNPKLPILVVSGYTDGAFAELFSEQPGLRLLAKPFLARELLGAVGEALSPK